MLLTLWTIRIATLFYGAALAGWILAWPSGRIRLLWTAGCACFIAHVVAAFAFQHHWSHAAAYRETARQTAVLFGVETGSGIYFNYLFAAVWIGDVVWWWRGRTKPRWLAACVHGFMAFMFLNGAIVFAGGAVRWISVMSAMLLIAMWIGRKRRASVSIL